MKKAYFLWSISLILLLGSWANTQTLPVTANRVFHVEATQASNTNDTTTDVLADGDKIYYWIDLSGAGKNVTQATVANQPLYKANRANSRPALPDDSPLRFYQSHGYRHT